MNIPRFSSSLLKKLAVLTCLLAGRGLAHAQTAKPNPTNLELLNRLLAKPDFKPGVVRMGDVLFPREKLNDYRDSLQRKTGTAHTNLAFEMNVTLWTNGVVPYQFAPDCSDAVKAVFLKAITEWPKVANVKFVERTTEANYLNVFTDPNAIGYSYSYLGMLGGPQDVSIDADTASFGAEYVVVHELGHALGCDHEHQRSDRDQYITIDFSNLTDDDATQFTIVPDSDNVTDYDFDSIMHYFANAFAIDPSKPTMICKPGYEQYQNTMGQQDHLSVLDAKGMLIKYPFPVVNDSTFSVNDASVVEGDSGSAKMTFTISLTPASTKPATITYATIGGANLGQATEDLDFISAKQLLTFDAGQTSKKITIFAKGDTIAEGNETFNFTLTGAGGAKLDKSVGVGTIIDDDTPPVASIANASAVEGGLGDRNLVNFTVTLSGPYSKPVTIKYTTKDGTATAGTDYTATTKSVTFAPRVTSQIIGIPVIGDYLQENNENFQVTLSDPSGATLNKKATVATGIITNDDETPKVIVTGSSVAEKTGNSKPMKFTIALSNPTTRTVTLKYGTTKTTTFPATPEVDYVVIPKSDLTFAPGETSKTVSVLVNDDNIDEDDETVGLKVFNVGNATVVQGTGIGTIIDDDSAPSLSVGDISVSEGTGKITTATFAVSLSNPSSKVVTVSYATADNTAVAGEDYTAVPLSTLKFNPGETTKIVNVDITGDALVEANEIFLLGLSEAENAKITRAQGKCTILNDDDKLPVLSVSSPSITEGDSGTKTVTFTIKLSAASNSPVKVKFATKDGTAKSGLDYTALESTLLTFAPGAVSKTVSVKVLGDIVIEADETFNLVLSSPENATLSEASGVATIFDNDGNTNPGPDKAKAPAVVPSAPSS